MKKFFYEMKAYAKVNLLLDVLMKRQDGFHELEGIMQSVSLYDVVTLTDSEDIEVASDVELPYNNTCRRAAELFLEGSGKGVRIHVKKNIPSEAGMGGASADAAAVLKGLNEVFVDTPLRRSDDELLEIGLKVGADVPFCLMGGCAIARGVGEELISIKGMRLPLLIVRGSRGVSTAGLFKSLGIGSEKHRRLGDDRLSEALKALENNSAEEFAALVGNALQPAASKTVPEIDEYCRRMMEQGALGASMTGSGAAVFGIFRNTADAEKALRSFEDCDFKAVCGTLTDICE